jgi:MazG family protein
MNFPNLEHLIHVISRLRDPNTGCPWDLAQDHKSLLKYLIEESYEYIQATEVNDKKKMEEELGDVLLQVILHAQIASEENTFDIESVAKVLSNKMIERHPHVFQDPKLAKTEEEVKKNWEEIKSKKKKQKYHISIDDVYAPSLQASENIGAKSADVNFDWDKLEDVMAKVDEELQEVKTEILIDKKSVKVKEEIGDLLFSVAQLARHLDIEPEIALKEANQKFVTRINQVEDLVKKDSKQMKDLPTLELEEYWKKVKAKSS